MNYAICEQNRAYHIQAFAERNYIIYSTNFRDELRESEDRIY